MAGKIYSVNRIKYWFTYDIDDICRVYKPYGLHCQTVRGWAEHGLKTIDKSRPILIYGNDLIEFLRKKNRNYKCVTTFDHMFCFKCHAPSIPYKKNIQLNFFGNAMRAKAFCRTCKTTMYKSYKLADKKELESTFHVVEVLELYNSNSSTGNTHSGNASKHTPNKSSQMVLWL